MAHANATLDFESAAMTPAGIPSSHLTEPTAKHEKDMYMGPNGGDEIAVVGAGESENDEEPTEEEVCRSASAIIYSLIVI